MGRKTLPYVETIPSRRLMRRILLFKVSATKIIPVGVMTIAWGPLNSARKSLSSEKPAIPEP
ncbi:hypothetical protein N9P82_00380, partial [bacterium]|nr:hypothetical protein [bacterium]